jgi:hypothetical protein
VTVDGGSANATLSPTGQTFLMYDESGMFPLIKFGLMKV